MGISVACDMFDSTWDKALTAWLAPKLRKCGLITRSGAVVLVKVQGRWRFEVVFAEKCVPCSYLLDVC